MSVKSNVPLYSHSDLEKVLDELTKLQKENLTLWYELCTTKQKVLETQRLAQIEQKVYSGIKKYFK